jgi:hypothetical protein
MDWPATSPTRKELVARVRTLTDDAVLMEAVALASPSIEQTCRQPLEQLSDKKLRTLAASLTAYDTRMKSRGTPFGLFAGVALAYPAKTTCGTVEGLKLHQRVVRPDAAWLHSIIRTVERSAHGLTSLEFAANPAVQHMDKTFLLPTPDARISRINMRATPALAAVMTKAAQYTAGHRLVEAARSHGITEHDAANLLATLVTRNFLISELQPPPHTSGALDYVITTLGKRQLHPQLTQSLEMFKTAATAYAAAPIGCAVSELQQVHTAAGEVAQAAGISQETGTPLHVDTIVDAHFTLGPLVVEEAQEAASVLARFAQNRGRRHLQQQLEQTSGGYALPLSEVPYAPLPATPPRSCPELLAAYAQALHQGRTEVTLDDELLDALAPALPGSTATEMDLFAVLSAPDAEAIDRGAFELHLRRPASSSAGTALARFAPGLGPAGEKALRAVHAAADLAAAEGPLHPLLHADVAFRPRQPDAENVARVTLTRAAQILTNSPSSSQAPDIVLSPQDLLLFPGPDGPQVWSQSLGVRVLPRATTALNTEPTAPSNAHVLAAAAGQNTALSFDWGVLATAPWLPRVRRGRTIYSPQTWRPGKDLVGSNARQEQWHERFNTWCQRWSVPAAVTLTDGDRQIPLRLDDPIDRSILHRQAQRGAIVLTEPLTREDCWARSPLGQHAVEIVLSLAETRKDHGKAAPLSATVPPRRPSPTVPVLPGEDWLRAQVACAGGQQLAFLRELSACLKGSEWFFTRPDSQHLDVCIRVGRSAVSTEDVLRCLHDVVDAAQYERHQDALTLRTYSRDAGTGVPSAHPDLLEAWAAADTRCTLAVLEADSSLTPLLSTLDLARAVAGITGTRILERTTPDRRNFAPLRRQVLPLVTDRSSPRGLLPEANAAHLHRLWDERAAATHAYLSSIETPAVDHASALLLAQHTARLTGENDAVALRSVAAAAEHAVASWHRATQRQEGAEPA